MAVTRGIILAAGKATRLHPASLAFGKQLMPVYDKPMIYYPLATLIEAGIRDILIIVTPRDRALFEDLLGDGAQLGISITYEEQLKQDGIAGAFLIGESFMAEDNVCLILGDNFFHGPDMEGVLKRAMQNIDGGHIICCHVDEPAAYGVAVLDSSGKVLRLVEKPAEVVSNWVVTGLYCYDNQACKTAKSLTPSARNELEITDLNIKYLERSKLAAVTLDATYRWFDLGTHLDILKAGKFIYETETRIGRKIGCPDEVAYRAGFISKNQVLKNAGKIGSADYANYLRALVTT